MHHSAADRDIFPPLDFDQVYRHLHALVFNFLPGTLSGKNGNLPGFGQKRIQAPNMIRVRMGQHQRADGLAEQLLAFLYHFLRGLYAGRIHRHNALVRYKIAAVALPARI